MKLKKAVREYIYLVQERERFMEDSVNYKRHTSEMRLLEGIISKKISKEG